MPQHDRRMLTLLERLFEIPSSALDVVLSRGADFIAEATECEKVDVFLHELDSNCLVAVGTAHTEMAQVQKSLGLDRLPIANRDPMAVVFETGEPYCNGAIQDDPTQPRGVVEGMGARSMLAVPIEIGAERRGVLALTSRKLNAFAADDLSLLKIVGAWVSNLVHRAELIDSFATQTREQAKRSAAEELITVLAHDLRNLLAPVVTRLSLLQEHARELDHKEDVEHTEKALIGLKRVSELMSDLLDVARVEQGLLALNREQFDLVGLARERAAVLATPAVAIEVDSYVPELRIVADRLRLSQAFENILANATKHSPRGAPVSMELRPIRSSLGDSVRILIVDRGPGITAELLPQIFERYVRSGPRAGLGLGLYLARANIAAHGGNIEIHSTPGQGTRCEIVLPLKPVQNIS
jgi:signal transduction histidine kinase